MYNIMYFWNSPKKLYQSSGNIMAQKKKIIIIHESLHLLEQYVHQRSKIDLLEFSHREESNGVFVRIGVRYFAS